MYSSTAFAPSPTEIAAPDLDSFAAFLEKLAGMETSAQPALQERPAQPVPVQEAREDEMASLSYERALRRTGEFPLPAPTAALATATTQSTALVAAPRAARASIRLSSEERDLVRQRAAESSLSVSAYVRSCVFEVESLREQVRQFMQQMEQTRSTSTAPQQPIIAQTPKQSSLPGATQPRQFQPAQARTPQSAPRYSNPRVQAAVEAQKRLAAQQEHPHKTQSKPGLFGFFFGARKSA